MTFDRWQVYRSKHAQAVADLANGGRPMNAVVFSVDRFVMDIRVPVGGFADRVKGIAFAFLCAVATGRHFFIDWKTPTRLVNAYAPADINWWAVQELVDARGPGAKCDWVDYGFSEEVINSIKAGRLEEDLFQKQAVATVWMNLWRPDVSGRRDRGGRLARIRHHDHGHRIALWQRIRRGRSIR